MACAADALSSRIFLNLLRRDLKACRTFGVASSLYVLLLSDTAILQYASVVESSFSVADLCSCPRSYLMESFNVAHGTSAIGATNHHHFLQIEPKTQIFHAAAFSARSDPNNRLLLNCPQ